MIFGAHVGDDVGRFDSGRAGVIVVKVPGEEFAVGSDGAFDFDDAGGTEVRPSEFFFAGPDDFDGAACGAGEARGFDGGVAGVLASVGGAGVGDDDADIVFGNAESVGEFAADAEGALRTGPDGERFAGPFGEGGARLERGVGDVADGVGGVETMRGTGECGVDRAFLLTMAVVGFGFRVVFQVRENVAAGDLRDFFPLRANGGEGGAGFALRGSGSGDEIAVANDGDAGDGSGRGVVIGGERCAKRGRAQNFAVQHASGMQVRRVLVAAGDEIAGVYFRDGLAGDGPVRRRRDGILRGKILRERFAAGEGRVGERAAGGGIGNFCVCGFEMFGSDAPFFGGDVDEEVAGGGSDTAELRRHGGRSAAAERSGVAWGERGVAHYHAHAFERYA